MKMPLVDTHVHTINSIHAYSTVEECVVQAKAKSVKGIVIAYHCTAPDCADSTKEHP